MDDIFPFLLVLALLFALVFAPIWILVKLSRIARRLDSLEVRLSRKKNPFAQLKRLELPQQEVIPAPQSEPVAPLSIPQPKPVAPPVPAPVPEVVAPPPEAAIPPALAASTPSKLEIAMDSLEARSLEILRKVWNFLAVGEEYRNPHVTREYAVATTWLIRIGFVTLLFGIGFFLKYSFEHGWISPAVRVAFMVIAGLAMAGVGAWRSSGKYRPFMIALAGAGFVTLYLSIMAAFRLYHLVPGSLAFGFMVLVTVAAMSTALGINALFPALLGCIGGFLTPYFIDTGMHDLPKCFLYMTILIAGSLFTAHYRSWILLHLSAFFCYALLGGTAIHRYLAESDALYLLITLSINFALFGGMALGTARRRDATLWELLLLLANAAFYFFMAVPIAQRFYAEWKIAAMLPLFAAALGVLESRYAAHRIDAKRLYLQMFLAAQVAFSLALVVPLLLGGVWIITAWSVLAFLMLKVALKSQSRILSVMSVVLYIVTQCRLFAYPETGTTYWTGLLHHFLSAGVLAVSWAAAAAMLFRAKAIPWDKGKMPQLQRIAAIVFAVVAGVLFLFFSSNEWHRAMKEFCPFFAHGVLVLWWSILLGVSTFFYRKRPLVGLFYPVLIGLSTLVFFEFFDMRLPSPWESYGKHLLAVLLTRGAYVLSLTAAGTALSRNRAPHKVTASVFALAGALFFLFSSLEIHTVLRHFVHGFANGGVSVWWSLCAMALLAGGIVRRQKALRVLGVLLFVLCAGKVFMIDLAHLEQIWRITAFAVIGVVMLLGAVLYIRFKELFAEEKKVE